ncbi:hypothetical protein Nmel_009944, partial [Mimus melanotis]
LFTPRNKKFVILHNSNNFIHFLHGIPGNRHRNITVISGVATLKKFLEKVWLITGTCKGEVLVIRIPQEAKC